MRTRWIFAVAAGLCLAIGFAAAQKPTAKKEDKDAIQGTWTVASGESDGDPLNDEIRSLKLTFKDEKMSALIMEETIEGKYKIDPAKKPKEIAVSLNNNGTEMNLKGIYELEGDNLKFCFPIEDGGPMPKEFTGKKDSKQRLLALKRAK